MKTSGAVIGVDTAKRVFQLHWVDMETGEIVDLKLTRAKFLEHFANLAPCVVAMEACGGSQHWARQLRELGHEPWLLPAKAVRPFVAGNKNDAHDARAIWTAAQMPGVRTVAVKSEEQQAILTLHRMRQQLVKFRTAQINGLRGLLTEYGEVMPQGRTGMRRGMAEALERVAERLPAMVIDTLREQWARVARLDEEIGGIERRIGLWHRGNADCKRIAEIPGVGVLTATAVVAAMGDPAAFRSGREFAAWLGLVPRHDGTGGRVRMLGIFKMRYSGWLLKLPPEVAGPQVLSLRGGPDDSASSTRRRSREALCRTRRLIGMDKRVRGGRSRAGCPGREGSERTRCPGGFLRRTGRAGGAYLSRGGTAVAVAA